MKRYLVRFTPMEPYFFGNEKTLRFPGTQTNHYSNLYFVRGEETPLQTALLGTLRFLLLEGNGRRADDFSPLSAAEQALIGKESFKAELLEKQSFGCIHNISALFITDKDGRYYVPIPMDHNTDSSHEYYSPLGSYQEMETLDGKKLFSPQYNPKAFAAAGWLCLSDNTVHGDLFKSELRVGINRRKDEDGFFKKEYRKLKDGFSFAVICEMEDDGRLSNQCSHIVSMGQGRSAFTVSFEILGEKKAAPEILLRTVLETSHREILKGEQCLIYCASDIFPQGELYEGLLFAASGSREYRSLRTQTIRDENGRERLGRNRHEVLYRLLRAGSVMIAPDRETAEAWIKCHKHENAAQLGFQQFVII